MTLTPASTVPRRALSRQIDTALRGLAKFANVAVLAVLTAFATLALLPTTARAADLTVSAAASLTNALRELGPAFEASQPGTMVVFNFAASDALVAQITQGAPVDVLVSADQQAMDRAEALRLLVPGSRRNVVSNTLVMVTPHDSTLGLKSLADLQGAGVKRIAIGNPASVPAGRYTRAALEAAGLWSAVEARAVFAQNVRQALDYVARAEVEVGFVYATDASVMKDKVRVVAVVPTPTSITYPAAAIAGRPSTAVANRFVDFLLTPAAQAVLARHGFAKP